LEEETGRRYHFTGSEGLPLDHFDIVMEGSRDEVMERAVPFKEGDEVLVHIVEPHMYDVDDAVAKIDGYIISVSGGGRFVGTKKLVRVEHAGRTSATAILLGEPEPAPEVPVKAPTRAARPSRSRRAKPAVAAVSEPAGGPQVAELEPDVSEDRAARAADPDPASPDGAAPTDDAQPPEDSAVGDGAEPAPRRRGRRGGRRRSRAAAESGAAEPSPAES
jgi:ribonuclease G